jgi:predicted CxxxxCH...CXXCH cytochrome family protein
MEVSMKRRNRFLFVWLALGLVLLAFSAFQTAMAAEKSVDTGLVPDQTSTGDPPLIPHEVEASDNGEDCLACHKDGDDDAPKIPEWHATLTDCRQCHIPYVKNSDVFKTTY